MKNTCACLLLLLHFMGVQAVVTKLQREVLKKASGQTNRSEGLRVASLALNNQIQQAAESLPAGATRDFLRTLRLCAKCNNYERFGEYGDGGYVMCTDGLESGLIGAMSYGISGYDGWGMDIAKRFHVPLHEYDCTNFQEPQPCTGCEVHFHPECIRSETQPAAAGYKTFSQSFSDAGFAGQPGASILLKIDVEAAEWEVFKSEPVSSLQMFREIVVEYHWLGDQSKHPLYLQAVKKIEESGFRVTHLHGNNFGGGLVAFGEYSIPNVLEVTYVRSTGCATGIPYKVKDDVPNNIMSAEIPDAHLPS